MYKPTFDRVAASTPNVIFQSINTDEGNPLILEHGIRNIPTTVVVENGVVRKQSGNLNEEQLRQLIG
jgi:thioredoxin-like negative regulator of GroEL